MSESSSSCPSSYSCSPSPEQTSTPHHPYSLPPTPKIMEAASTPQPVSQNASPFVSPYNFHSRTPASIVNGCDAGPDVMLRSFMQVGALMQEQYMRQFGVWAAMQTGTHIRSNNNHKMDLAQAVPLNLSSPLHTPMPAFASSTPRAPQTVGVGGTSVDQSRSYSVINQTDRVQNKTCDEQPADPVVKPTPDRSAKPAKVARKEDVYQSDPEQNIQDLEELDKFANQFKQARLRHGFTQQDVGMALGKLYGTDFSQTTISRFEALNLSFRNMCKLKPQLEQWISDMDRAVQDGNIDLSQPRLKPVMSGVSECVEEDVCLDSRRRKKRTSIANDLRDKLELVFQTDSRPDKATIMQLARELDSDKDTIRVWFCNRRQKARKTEEIVSPQLQTPNFGLCVCTEGSLLTSLDSKALANKTIALNKDPLYKSKEHDANANLSLLGKQPVNHSSVITTM